MRIGIDARMYGSSFTGIGRYTYELIHHLLALDSRNEYVIFLRKDQYEMFRPLRMGVTKVLADYPHYSVAEQTGFLRLLNRSRLDLMHFTHFNAPLAYNRLFVVTIHDLTLSYFPGKKMRDLLHRLGYHLVIRNVVRKAARIIAVSAHTKKDLCQLLSVPEKKIEVIYHGLNPDFGHTLAADVDKTKVYYQLQNPYFLYTGVWREHKNIVGLLKAFALFTKQSERTFDLVLTGKEDPYYPEVKAAIRDFDLEYKVRLVGLVPEGDLQALYKGAFAYVFPSFYEGFGFPPLEAMQCGVPVLASNTSSIPEICGKGNALYFDPNDLEDMVQKMISISEDQPLRDHLIQRGLSHVKTFSWDTMAKNVFILYQNILHGTD